MSNIKRTNNPKVISLRKVNDLKQKEDSEQLTLEEQEATLRIEIEKKKQELASLQEQKQKMLQDMKTAIQKEKEEWLETKEEERKKAEKIGYKVGYDAGEEKAIQDFSDLIHQANEIVETASRDYHKTIEKHESAIVQLAITTAEKIINEKVEKDHDYFKGIVVKAMKELKDKSTIAIYLHPNNYKHVSKQADELEQIVEDGDIISLYVDENLQEGDCVIKHPFGQIEVGIDLQLKQIKNALEEKITES